MSVYTTRGDHKANSNIFNDLGPEFQAEASLWRLFMFKAPKLPKSDYVAFDYALLFQTVAFFCRLIEIKFNVMSTPSLDF